MTFGNVILTAIGLLGCGLTLRALLSRVFKKPAKDLNDVTADDLPLSFPQSTARMRTTCGGAFREGSEKDLVSEEKAAEEAAKVPLDPTQIKIAELRKKQAECLAEAEIQYAKFSQFHGKAGQSAKSDISLDRNLSAMNKAKELEKEILKLGGKGVEF